MKKPKQAKNNFNLVVENAFDFFKKSLSEFDKEPNVPGRDKLSQKWSFKSEPLWG